MSIAAIGPSPFVTCFELIGINGFEAESGEELAKILLELVEGRKFKLIVLPERFAKETDEIRSLVMKKGEIWPVFALIPDLTMVSGMRLEELKSIVSLAIGAKLEL
jgi:vacuolar-type H+-ATPase subunit F/Vma7